MNLSILQVKLGNINLNANKKYSCSFNRNSSSDIFLKSNDNEERSKLRNQLIENRKLSELEKWIIIHNVKEDDCKANDDIRYYMKRGKFYEGLDTREFDRIFQKNKADTEYTVYRGTDLRDFGYNITNKESMDNFFEEGKVIIAPTYLSTSLDKEYSKKLANKSSDKLLFKINIKPDVHSVYVDKLLTPQEKAERNYRFDDEEEVFVDRLAMLKMKDKYTEGDYTIIELDALGHEDSQKYMTDNNLKEL